MRNTSIPKDSIILLFVVSVSLGFGLLLSISLVTDPFTYFDTGFLKIALNQGKLVVPESGPFTSLRLVPGRIVLMAQFVRSLGISPEEFQFMPIGAVFLSIVLYFFSRQILNSSVLAGLITIYLTINLSHSTALYSTFAYALGIPLFFGFLLLGSRFFEKRDLREFFLILILFVALNYIHYTLTTWTISFLIGANIAIVIQKLMAKGEGGKLTPVYYLSIALVVFFLYFNKTLYESYIPLIAPETLDSAVQRFFSYIFLGQKPYPSSPYNFTRDSSINFISTITLALILLPILGGFLNDLWQLLVKRSKSFTDDKRLPVIWGIFILGIADALVYSFRGSISTKTFSIIFPLITILYLQRTNKKILYYGMAIILVATSIGKIAVFSANSYVLGQNGVSYERLEISTSWLKDYTDNKAYTMLADMDLYGKYLVSSMPEGGIPLFQGFTLEDYRRVIGETDTSWNIKPDMIAIDKANVQPTVGFVWLRLQPLSAYEQEIMMNPNINIIYDDGAILLAKPRDK